MKAILVNYKYTPDWLKDYPDIDYLIADRSEDKEYLKDFPQDKIRYTKNVGDVDYDKLSYLVEHYDNLPEVFLWSKTNLFKFITKEEFDAVKDTDKFTPLLTRNHKTYSDRVSEVCFYQGEWYMERNDSWYLNVLPHNHFNNFGEWARHFGLPNPEYLPFAPGGSYILTRERVHKYSRDFYDEMRSFLPYCQTPGEAHLAERSYGLMWK